MTPAEIIQALTGQGTSLGALAEQLGVSYGHVRYVVRRERESTRIEQAIADAIGRPVQEVFPARERAAAPAA